MNLAIIGLGVMGKNHYEELKKRKINLHLYDIVKPDWLDGSDLFYDDLNELLKNKIDGVIIVTPTIFHYEIFCKIYKNVKNILIEKPISFNIDEALKIKELSKNNNICIGFCERFNPVSKAFKEISKNEKIIYANFIRASIRPNRINDIGVDLDLSVHDIDLANFFGIKADFNVLKTGNPCTQIQLSSQNLQILASWQFHCKIRKATINTDLASYELDFLNYKLIKNNETYDIYKSSSLSGEHEDFLNLIKTNDFGHLATIDDAIYVQKILE